MRLAVATTRGQGERPGDFSHTVDGELVMLGLVCATDTRNPDSGGCGCGRAFSGFASHRATTTAEIRELDISDEDLVIAVRAALEAHGWLRWLPDDECEQMVCAVVGQLLEVGRAFPVGTLVGRRLDDLVVRGLPEEVTR
ncbi:hypothetical protein CLV35_2649 [Motilibacter peucedani]|uniref:DUF7715 domain-containing protein n=1 Tax=Motilibacter peucedani TaxID=598650 RepID=A0A420XMF6_9ACTN|nr:hypothetical protein [Motilibacter peucedani]RKS72405.1 hypothetical protein CLV35_2649 [Motilibacter peucedani]